MDLDSLDGRGRTCPQIAEAAKAVNVNAWIAGFKARKSISDFVTRNYQRIRAVQKHRRMVRSAIGIQKLVRGFFTRKIHRGSIVLRLEESHRFNAIWSTSIDLLQNQTSSDISGWPSVRARISDISCKEAFDAEDFDETCDKLDKALAGVVLDADKEDTRGKIAFPATDKAVSSFSDFFTRLIGIGFGMNSTISILMMIKMNTFNQRFATVRKLPRCLKPIY